MKRTTEITYRFECPHPEGQEHFESVFQRPVLDEMVRLSPDNPMVFITGIARTFIGKWGGTANTAMTFAIADGSEVYFCGSACTEEEYIAEQFRLWPRP